MRGKRGVMFVLAAGLLLVGCTSAPRPPQPVELTLAKGFQFQINMINNAASVAVGSAHIDRKLTLQMRCFDGERHRVVAFAKGVTLDAVRDEKGRDLLPYLDEGTTYGPKPEPDQFDSFANRSQVEKGAAIGTNQLSRVFDDLPTNPTRLEVIRGTYQIVEATRLSTVDIPLERTDQWIEVSPGLKLRIESAVRNERNVSIRCQMQTARTDDEFDILQERRWYWIDVISADGTIKQSQPAVPEMIKGGGGFWTTSVSIREGDPDLVTLRVMVIDEMVIHKIPFEYHDVAVQ